MASVSSKKREALLLKEKKYLLLVFKISNCVFRIKLFFQVFISFASMSHNPDAGIKDPHFSLKL